MLSQPKQLLQKNKPAEQTQNKKRKFEHEQAPHKRQRFDSTEA